MTTLLDKTGLKNMYRARPNFTRYNETDMLVDSLGMGRPVLVSGDWSDEDDVWADIQAAIPYAVASGYTLVITLWEGPDDPDDYATLTVTYSAGESPSLTLAFTSAPAADDVVLIVGTSVTYSA
jgi:hypothetical protein